MVTLQEAISQRSRELGVFEQQLSTQERKILEAEQRLTGQEQRFLAETKPQELTLERQITLGQAFGFGAVGQTAKEIRREKKKAREVTIPKITKAKTEIKKARKQIAGERARVQPFKEELTQLQAFQTGFKAAQKGAPPIGFGKAERRGFVAGVREEKAAKQRAELLKIGKPIFSEGMLTGFEKDQMSIPLALLPERELRQLEQADIIRFKEQRDFTPIEDIKLDFKEPDLRMSVREEVKEDIGIGGRFFTKVGETIDPFVEKGIETTKDIFFQEVKPLEEIKQLPADQQGREAAKFIFLGGLLGIKEKLRSKGLTGKVAGEFIPTAPAGALTLGLAPLAISKASPLVRKGILGGFTFAGGKEAFDVEAPTEQRIAGGIIAGLGGLGLAAEFPKPKLTGLFTKQELVPFEKITISEPFAQAPKGTTAAELQTQFRQQRLVTEGVDKIIRLPGEPAPGVGGVRVFTGTTGIKGGKEFAPFLGGSREPGLFVSPQLSKEFLRLQSRTEPTLFGLDVPFGKKQPTAFRLTFEDIGRIPQELISGVKKEGVTGFKGFATPEQQRIISFRAEELSPFKPAISTRFELVGGEIEAIARPGAVLREFKPQRLFTEFEGQKIPIREFRPTGEVVTPKDLITRRRGTAIVETPEGILLTFAPEEKAFTLPGGGIDKGELALKGTIREVKEETGLSLVGGEFIGEIPGRIKRFGKKRKGKDPFRFVQEQFETFKFDVPKVGGLKPSKEVQKLAFFQPGKKFKGEVSPTTLEILKLGGIDIKGLPKPKVSKPSKIKETDLGLGEITLRDLSKLSEESFGISKRPLITPSRILGGGIGRRGVKPSRTKKPSLKKKPSRIITPIPGSNIFPTIAFGSKSKPIIEREPISPFIKFPFAGLDIDPFEKPKPQKKVRKLIGSDRSKRKKISKKLIIRQRKIKPSITGILTAQGIRAPTTGREFEFAAAPLKVGGKDIGISPFALRGTRTGLAPLKRLPKKRTTKKIRR